jgi:hypothetical protein
MKKKLILWKLISIQMKILNAPIIEFWILNLIELDGLIEFQLKSILQLD